MSAETEALGRYPVPAVLENRAGDHSLIANADIRHAFIQGAVWAIEPNPEVTVKVARAIMIQLCRVETEGADWEAGTPTFSWCDNHYPDCEPKDDTDEEYCWGRADEGVCPEAMRAAELALEALAVRVECEP
jgi:hypothetical protein